MSSVFVPPAVNATKAPVYTNFEQARNLDGDLTTTEPLGPASTAEEPASSHGTEVPITPPHPVAVQVSPVMPTKQFGGKHLLSRLADYNKPGLTELQPDGCTTGTAYTGGDMPRRSTRSSSRREIYDAASGVCNKLA